MSIFDDILDYETATITKVEAEEIQRAAVYMLELGGKERDFQMVVWPEKALPIALVLDRGLEALDAEGRIK